VAYPGKAPSRSDSALSTLPLLMYLAIAIGLMIADHRHGFGAVARQQAALATRPIWWLASSPTRLFRAGTETLATRGQLQADNERKRHDLQLAIARIHRLNAVADENVRLRRLLGGTRGYALDVRMAGIVDIDLDPFRQRLVLDAGAATPLFVETTERRTWARGEAVHLALEPGRVLAVAGQGP
jgi:rod shape-determining protein MreC